MNFSLEIAGGLMIGLASALPLLFEGRIAGVSGYAASLAKPQTIEGKTGAVFVLGLILGGLLWKLFEMPVGHTASTPVLVWAAAGLLVGIGSRMAGGCTSGHGVCGLGRLSVRSLVSVLIFMSAAIITRWIWRLFP